MKLVSLKVGPSNNTKLILHLSSYCTSCVQKKEQVIIQHTPMYKNGGFS